MENEESIVSLFDSVCVAYGDLDAIVYPLSKSAPQSAAPPPPQSPSICYLELQEYSKDLACQVLYRFRPAYVLVDCLGHVAAETVALLACMRIGVTFVPVSSQDQHAGGRMNVVVEELQRSRTSTSTGTNATTRNMCKVVPRNMNIVAIVCCEDDQDPMLGVFAQADINQILYVDKTGNLRERLNVPTALPLLSKAIPTNDNLYVLFTSGTSSNAPKAVIGSHKSTLRRLLWFRETFEPSSRVGRRTRLTFVDSIAELFQALLCPPSVLVAVDEPNMFHSEGLKALLDLECTQLTILPSQLSQILMLPQRQLNCLERVFVSGEPCPAALLGVFRTKLPKASLINLYGQTETTGDVLYAILTDMSNDDSPSAAVTIVNHVVTVGKPIPPNTITLTPDGELMVKGNLSNGYLNNTVPSSFEEFATGDLGFCRGEDDDERIWYVRGRKADITKVNGILTSPSEVEAAFCRIFGHSDVAATIINNQVYALVDTPVLSFSRERMREEGLPWNLIPKRVILCDAIPRQATGAGKIDRRQVHEMIRDTIGNGGSKTAVSSLWQKDDDMFVDFDSVLATVLQISIDEVDQTKSFVELGGDSASAVTLLYQLRLHNLSSIVFTATDLLQSGSIADLKTKPLACSEEATPIVKRQRTTKHYEFQSQALRRYSDCHVAVTFAACVDATPLLHQRSIYAACQKGVIQRVNVDDGTVEACYHLLGWMVQAGLVVVKDDKSNEALIVCAYTRENKGLVASLSLALKSIHWKLELEDFAIKTTPVFKDSCLWISNGKSVRSVSAETGMINETVYHLPLTTATQPIIHNKGLLYPSSEYDTGLVHFCSDDGSGKVLLFGELGPIHKNAKIVDGSVFVSDSYGSVHCVTLTSCSTENTIKTFYLSDKPLTSPCILKDFIVVGSYNGMVYCLDRTNWTALKWEFNAGATIYCTPLALSDGWSVVVLTTAGDVIRISTANGSVLWRGWVPGEIWSDPIELLDDHVIAFGARDSQLHVVTMNTK